MTPKNLLVRQTQYRKQESKESNAHSRAPPLKSLRVHLTRNQAPQGIDLGSTRNIGHLMEEQAGMRVLKGAKGTVTYYGMVERRQVSLASDSRSPTFPARIVDGLHSTGYSVHQGHLPFLPPPDPCASSCIICPRRREKVEVILIVSLKALLTPHAPSVQVPYRYLNFLPTCWSRLRRCQAKPLAPRFPPITKK
jgi:hypothetical protein